MLQIFTFSGGTSLSASFSGFTPQQVCMKSNANLVFYTRLLHRQTLPLQLFLLKSPHYEGQNSSAVTKRNMNVTDRENSEQKCYEEYKKFRSRNASRHNQTELLHGRLTNWPASHLYKQKAECIWQKLHRMTPHTRHAVYSARAAADLSHVTNRQFSTSIYNTQLSRMSHCAPVARKPLCFKFTPEAAVGDILIA